jgi:hypothetical protein
LVFAIPKVEVKLIGQARPEQRVTATLMQLAMVHKSRLGALKMVLRIDKSRKSIWFGVLE